MSSPRNPLSKLIKGLGKSKKLPLQELPSKDDDSVVAVHGSPKQTLHNTRRASARNKGAEERALSMPKRSRSYSAPHQQALPNTSRKESPRTKWMVIHQNDADSEPANALSSSSNEEVDATSTTLSLSNGWLQANSSSAEANEQKLEYIGTYKDYLFSGSESSTMSFLKSDSDESSFNAASKLAAINRLIEARVLSGQQPIDSQILLNIIQLFKEQTEVASGDMTLSEVSNESQTLPTLS